MVSSFPGLRDALTQLLEDSLVPPRGGGATGPSVAPRPLPLDVYATAGEAVIIAAVPGMAAQELELTVDQNTVTLSGRLPSAVESEQGQGATWFLHELWHGPFRRSVTLPFEVDAGRAEATVEQGIVRIVLPKAAQAKPQRIAIKAAGGPEAVGAGGHAPPH
jgi:HSP20 family protein